MGANQQSGGRRTVALCTSHFPPSNLAGVHRVRIMARHLAEFGWEPVVVTVHPRHYDGPMDEKLTALIPRGVRVEFVEAFPAWLCRPFGLGDVVLRGYGGLRRKLGQLAREGLSAVFATVLPGYIGLLGAGSKRRHELPFVLDYQDPYVSDWGSRQPRWSKAGLAHRLALNLEPRFAPLADALTAVSSATLDTLRERGLLRDAVPTEEIPIGADPADHVVAAKQGTSRINRADGDWHLAYLGSITDRMVPATRALFRAVRQLTKEFPGRRLRLHLIGFDGRAEASDVQGLAAEAARAGVAENVRLESRRIGYLDALRTMHDADALLLLGSTDPHYTASKLFPYWLSGKPVVGLFHSASTVNKLAREFGGVGLVNYDGKNGPETRTTLLGDQLQQIMGGGLATLPKRNEAAFEPCSARGIARAFASVFDRVAARAG